MPISQNTRNVLADPRRRATFELQNEAGRMAEERLSLIGVSSFPAPWLAILIFQLTSDGLLTCSTSSSSAI